MDSVWNDKGTRPQRDSSRIRMKRRWLCAFVVERERGAALLLQQLFHLLNHQVAPQVDGDELAVRVKQERLGDG